MFSELWAWHQAEGNSVCFPEPNTNKGWSLQPSAPAANPKGLPSSSMPCLESQQVAGGMFVLLAAPYHTDLWNQNTQLSSTMHKHNWKPPGGYRSEIFACRERLANHSLVYFCSRLMCPLSPSVTQTLPAWFEKLFIQYMWGFHFRFKNSLAKC